MSNPRLRAEHALLLRLARPVLEPDVVAEVRRCAPRLDWEHLLDRADAHGMMPMLARHMPLLEAAVPELPARAAEASRSFAALHRLHALRHMEELLGIVADGRAGGVPILPYKGPALGVQAFGDPAARVFDDLDVLVPIERVAAARELLLGRGYRTPAAMTAKRTAAQLHWGHHEKYEHPEGFLVELHWRLAGGAHTYALSFEELWERRESLSVAGRSLDVLSNEDTVLVLCVHGAIHGWCSLSWVTDVAALLDGREIDWDLVRERAAALRRTRMVRLGLLLATELMEARLPAAVDAWVRADGGAATLLRRLGVGLFDDPQPRNGGSLLFQLGTREGVRDKLSLLAKGTLSVAELDWEWVELPRPLFPLYHVVRPVRLMVRFARQALS